jgi:hypothetical protein
MINNTQHIVDIKVLKYKLTEAESDEEFDKLLFRYLDKKGFAVKAKNDSESSPVVTDDWIKPMPTTYIGSDEWLKSIASESTESTGGRRAVVRKKDISLLCVSQEIYNETKAQYPADIRLSHTLNVLGSRLGQDIINSGWYNMTSSVDLYKNTTIHKITVPVIQTPITSMLETDIYIKDLSGWKNPQTLKYL